MKRSLGLALIAVAALAVGCKNEQLTPIRTLLDDPSQYDRKVVRVFGKVAHSVGVLGYGGYQVDDGSGTLTVVSNQGGAPRTGAEVGVEGEFRSGYTLGTQSAAVLLERRRYTRR